MERHGSESYFVIGEGLLPPELLEEAVMERYVAARKTALASSK